MPKALADQADRVANKIPTSRSELVREALRQYLADREEWDAIFAYGRKQAKKLGIREEDIVGLVREVRKSESQV